MKKFLIPTIIVLWAIIVAALNAGVEPHSYTLFSGVLNATELEAKDGFYAVGNNGALMARPDSEWKVVLDNILRDRPEGPIVTIKIEVHDR